MGTAFSSLSNEGRWRWKRKREDSSEEEADLSWDLRMHTPMRKKLMTTSQYIYKTVFLEGHNSDVTIVALGTEWHLHKVYLCQSPYFASMFGGSWREAAEGSITIGIEDPRVTIDALRTVFGSFYQDELLIEPIEVLPVVAAATLFQMDGVIQQCSEVMSETISMETVLNYYEAARQYGLKRVEEQAFSWLLRNLMTTVQEYPKYLRQIGYDLMAFLVASPHLIVMQTEFSLYIMLKIWLFLQENYLWDGDTKECTVEAHKYFQGLSDDCFLATVRGKPCLPAFRALRLQHLVNHHLDVELLESDHIIPTDWFMPIFKDQWYTMLRIDQGVDRGPKQVTEEEFDRNCLRCGRVLPTEIQHIWRWTGFNFGLDLIVTYQGRCFRFRRNSLAESDAHSLASRPQPPRRHMMYRLTVHSQDTCGQVTYTKTSGLQSLSMARNEEVKALMLDREATFPLFVSASFLVTTPLRTAGSIDGTPDAVPLAAKQ